jgi:hypothetical protein
MAEYCSLVFDVMEKTHTKLVASWAMFLIPFITACHPDTAKIIIKETYAKPKNSIVGYRLVLPWLGEALFYSL